MQGGSLVGLGGKEEACLERMALERGRIGAAVENALFPWGTMLCGWVLVKSEVGGGEGRRHSSEDFELLCKEQQKTVAQGLPLPWGALWVGMSRHSLPHPRRTVLARELSALKPSFSSGFK